MARAQWRMMQTFSLRVKCLVASLIPILWRAAAFLANAEIKACAAPFHPPNVCAPRARSRWLDAIASLSKGVCFDFEA
jgi:hypothetical protein